MPLIRHCIVDTNTNLIVNIVEYEQVQVGVPPGLDANLLCVANDTYAIGDSYVNGVFTAAPQPVAINPAEIK